MQPAISANDAHEVYVYSFGSDKDRICAFQVYDSEASANAFLQSDQYRAYQRDVEPLLEGPPEVEVLQPRWVKGATGTNDQIFESWFEPCLSAIPNKNSINQAVKRTLRCARHQAGNPCWRA